MGRAIAKALGEKGARVAINYRSNREKAEEALDLLRGMGVESRAYRADVADPDQVGEMMDGILHDFGSLDILVNNSGVTGDHRRLEEVSNEEWQRLIDVNLTGMFNCCKAAIPRMGEGKVVNMTSVAGKMGGTMGPHYAATKAGNIGLTFSLATEFAPRIMVNAVAPGPVETDMLDEGEKRRMCELTPFGRIATPEEVAHCVVFLVENDYITGEVIDINAGRYMD
ncbi:MAG: SDR family NAD(P)-dependent oxidoreductase [Methanomassiliicoccales archaeon]